MQGLYKHFELDFGKCNFSELYGYRTIAYVPNIMYILDFVFPISVCNISMSVILHDSYWNYRYKSISDEAVFYFYLDFKPVFRVNIVVGILLDRLLFPIQIKYVKEKNKNNKNQTQVCIKMWVLCYTYITLYYNIKDVFAGVRKKNTVKR